LVENIAIKYAILLQYKARRREKQRVL